MGSCLQLPCSGIRAQTHFIRLVSHNPVVIPSGDKESPDNSLCSGALAAGRQALRKPLQKWTAPNPGGGAGWCRDDTLCWTSVPTAGGWGQLGTFPGAWVPSQLCSLTLSKVHFPQSRARQLEVQGDRLQRSRAPSLSAPSKQQEMPEGIVVAMSQAQEEEPPIPSKTLAVGDGRGWSRTVAGTPLAPCHLTTAMSSLV